MNLEDVLNLELRAYRIVQCTSEEGPMFRAEIPGYPLCTGFGATAPEALRAARHLFTQLRDGQAAVTVCDLEHERSERLCEAMRFVVKRALI